MKKVNCKDCGTEIEVADKACNSSNWVCNNCKKNRNKLAIERYHIKHPGRHLMLAKKRYEADPLKFSKRSLEYYNNLTSEKREARLLYSSRYNIDNREHINELIRISNQQPHNKIAKNLRIRIYRVLKNQNTTKNKKTEELTGCTFEELRDHLSKQFKIGMTWNNYGAKGWTIDHIKPCASFNLTLEEEQRKCFHYTNLQPLWAKENLIKSNKY